YRLAQWRRSQRIVLDANPNFRDERYPAPPRDSPEDALIAKGLVGRRLPLTPRVDIRIVEEEQPRLLGFRAGEFDYLGLTPGSVPEVVDGGHLKPEYAKRGIVLHHGYEQALSYTYINMADPVIGGYALAQIALRRAIAMAYDTATEIRVLEAGQGSIATQLVPPPIPGYDPAHIRGYGFDPAEARALLDHFAYKAPKGSIYRDLPDGRPLTLTMGTTPDSASRQYDELWKRCLDAIGIRVKFLIQSWPDLLKMATAGKLQMWQLGMGAPTPDADIFYTMLYSGSAGLFNLSRFHLPAYDRAYEASARLPDGPARYAEFRRMDALVDAYAPLILNRFPQYNVVAQPWLKGFKMNIFAQDNWAYYTVERHSGSARAR
ncbi:MAG: ABC transporter substrate-binding protein, partial [Betaproteobacteria bacterium]